MHLILSSSCLPPEKAGAAQEESRRKTEGK